MHSTFSILKFVDCNFLLQNAPFCIKYFKNFPGDMPPDPPSRLVPSALRESNPPPPQNFLATGMRRGQQWYSGFLSKGPEIGSGSRNYEFSTGYPIGNMIDMISLLTLVTPILKLYCGFKYTRPLMINRVWGLKQL